MRSASNPEQTGSTTYSYDANSNLFTKTDPRGITTTFTYDALNRVKTRTYQNDLSGTPPVTYNYDDINVPKSKGRLTSEVTPVSSYSYSNYDAMGRVLGGTQTTTVNQTANSYSMSYTYDLAGNMRTETYPSGRVVTTTYDGEGRINGITGQKTGEANKTYASAFSYASHGAVKSMRLSDPATSNLWEHTLFNARFQPAEIGLGTTAADSSKLKLEYTYGITNNNGNVLTQKITIGANVINQSYTYDGVNRLWTATETGAWSQSA